MLKLMTLRANLLRVRAGNVDGASFRIKPAIEVKDRFQRTVTGELRDFSKVAVITGKRTGKSKTYRYYELAPGKQQNELKLGDFYVCGKFEIVKSILKSKPANEAWKSFEAARENGQGLDFATQGLRSEAD